MLLRTSMTATAAAALTLLSGCGEQQLCAGSRMLSGTPGRAQQPCGACFTLTSFSDPGRNWGTAGSAKRLARAAALGLRSVSLVPYSRVDSNNCCAVTDGVTGLEQGNRARLEQEIKEARRLGLEVMIKPHLTNDAGGWVGDFDPSLKPGGLDQFFASYGKLLEGYAALAQSAGAQWLCVGAELWQTTVVAPERWRALIARVRKIYSGKLIYGANWDKAERIKIWDAVDAMGVQMFAPISDQTCPTGAQLLEGARQRRDQYLALARSHGLPLVLTEVGYINREGTTIEPWTWPQQVERPVATRSGDLQQADAYQAIFETFGHEPEVRAIYWWHLLTDPDYREPGGMGYQFVGKPAEDVLTSACK